MDSWIYRPGHPVVSIERGPRGLVLSQQRFAFAADPAGGIEAPAADVRSIPVVLRVGADGAEQVHRALLDDATTDLPLDVAPDWVVGNHEGNGFYRVALTDADAAALAARASGQLSPLERYGLVEDEWALLLAGGSSVSRVLDVVRRLGHDDDLSVWQRSVAVLTALHRVAGPDARPRLEAWVRGLVGPALLRLGDVPTPDEDDRTRALRATLLDAAARVGADEHRRAQATRTFTELGADSAAVDAEVADAVVRIVAATADGPTWEELRRRATAASTAQDRLRHQGALADGRDVGGVVRFCDLCFTDEVRSQDALFLLRRALANRHATAAVWELLTQRWTEIHERFPSAMVPRLLEGVRTIADPHLAGEVAAFLEEHATDQGAAVVRQHVERMWVTVALGRRAPRELDAALP
jgi:puromycin-sensitive aminopeptidase